MGSKTKIDWADATWNPVTGCLHGCEYCYARGIANRFAQSVEDCISENADLFTQKWLPLYEEFIFRFHHQPWKVTRNGKHVKSPYPCGFAPTFHEYRLDEPRHWKKPRTIFVCSMADLFGKWVSDEWIEKVFKACEAAPWHRYMFLTKNPKRYECVLNKPMPKNMWFGWSQEGPIGSQSVFSTDYKVNTFVSIEPLLQPFEAFYIRGVDWVIVGAETGNRKNKVIPEKKWVDDIANACRDSGVPLFMKESLRGLMGDDFRQEFPWEARTLTPVDANMLDYADNPTV